MRERVEWPAIKRRSKLGRALLLWRTSEGVSLRDMAAQIGISAATLSRYERGKDMNANNFVKLLAWLTEEKG